MNASAFLLLLVTPGADPKGRLDLDPEDVKPGLVAEFPSLTDPKTVYSRIEPKPAFTLGRSSPHPRVPACPFEVNYTGVISIRDAGPTTFSAFVGGEIVIKIDGETVLEGRGSSETSLIPGKSKLDRPPGYYRLEIRYRSLADVPARLQIWWEAPSFAREPIPPWRFAHIVSDLSPAAQHDQLAATGRSLAGRFGCARCHAGSMPAVDDPPPGPSLADIGNRLSRRWLFNWLADPAKLRADAHMPVLFSPDRAGYIERWLVADYLSGGKDEKRTEEKPGNHRGGRLEYLGLGCAACHFVPDVPRSEQSELNRSSLATVADRFSANELETFIKNPHARYPDGRMPRLPVTAEQAREIVAYLFLWSKPTEVSIPGAITLVELQDTIKRLGARDARSAAAGLLRDKGCVNCHTGLGDTKPRDVPIKNHEAGCLSTKTGPRFSLDEPTRKAIIAYLGVAVAEKYPSPFAARQQKLKLAGCMQCHSRDGDKLAPLEEAGSKLGGAFLQELPFMRTPRLTYPHQKLTRSYLAATVREGNPNLRWSRYSYKMPAFGANADELIQALAEGDGELITDNDPPIVVADDPTLGTLHGQRLAGFQGYACASCHVWNGNLLGSPDPVATGPDLTRTAGRIRRDWFDRYVESPLRFYPGTPMPAIFPHGKPATLANILDGGASQQKDALWAYFAQGKDAPSPKPPPAVPVAAPTDPGFPLIAQVPIRLADGKIIESICLLTASHDLLVYDLASGWPHVLLTGGSILRNVQGRIRQFLVDGRSLNLAAPSTRLIADKKAQEVAERTLLGYDRIPGGARFRWKLRFLAGTIEVDDSIRFVIDGSKRRLYRDLSIRSIPLDCLVELHTPGDPAFEVSAGDAKHSAGDRVVASLITPDREKKIAMSVMIELPAAAEPPKWDLAPAQIQDDPDGTLNRPGYRAIAYSRPKTVSGEDRILPGAVAVRPKDGQVFVASMKTGELFALRDGAGDGKNARFENYGNALYQDALSMLAEDDGLYVLHRRNLTKITEKGGVPTSFDRIAALPHGIADTYDMAYGLARDKEGRFVFGYAAYADGKMSGAGGVLRLKPGKPPEEVAYGLRNALGWCAGPDGEVFFTDNQGDWVATNKLCHIEEGKFYGWPNRSQPQHTTKPAGKAAVWVPYGWARSINGVAYDNTGGKFGPFAGQFFMAELMFGGAIIRANVEKVNGVYQGACFPFWGKGLLGPVTLAFDPRGKLYVGGITEPGWMAQPDRGALFRIDYTGEVPFEMQSIHVRPQGFRIVFTTPVDRKTAENPDSYRLEHYRYEYTGAYGSPELDRTGVKVERVEVAADGKSAELTTKELVKDRVYMITPSGVRSADGKKLVNATGAYTLNVVPVAGKQ